MPDLTNEFKTLMAGKAVLPAGIEELRARYADAKPFPHVVMDGLFADGLLDSVLDDMARMRREQWSSIDQDSRERTSRMRSAIELGPAGTQFLSIIHSAGFLYLLSEITGVPQLLPDPYLQGAGYASMRRGDYFSVHADRNVAYETGLVRRLAMITFLNKSWSAEYEGRLELWTPDGKRCDATVEPVFNKTVVFEVAFPNYHGVPVPLACPADRMRQSFITYYHTAASKEPAEIKPHTSIFAPRLYGTNRVTLRSFARDVTPPFLARIIRNLGKKE